MAQSPEIETLDQLLGGQMPLGVIRRLYESDDGFTRGTLALLRSGDVRLFDQSHTEVPPWRWRALFEEGQVLAALGSFALRVTETGAAKVS